MIRSLHDGAGWSDGWEDYTHLRHVRLSEIDIDDIQAFILVGDHDGGCLVLRSGEMVTVIPEVLH